MAIPKLNTKDLPFKKFLIRNRKFRVIAWGQEVKGKKSLNVRTEVICTDHAWPGMGENEKMFEMKFPIESEEFRILE